MLRCTKCRKYKKNMGHRIHCISKLRLRFILEECSISKLELYNRVLKVTGISKFLKKRKYICCDKKSWILIEILNGVGYISKFKTCESALAVLNCPLP
jgi:hypothetical protein